MRCCIAIFALVALSAAQQCDNYEIETIGCDFCQLTCDGEFLCGKDLDPNCDAEIPTCRCDFQANGAVIDSCGFCARKCGKCYEDDCPGGLCTGYSFTCNNATKQREDYPVCLQTTTTNPCVTNPDYCGFARRCVFSGGYAFCNYIDPCEATDCGPGNQCTYITINQFYPDNCDCRNHCDYIPTCVPSPS